MREIGKEHNPRQKQKTVWHRLFLFILAENREAVNGDSKKDICEQLISCASVNTCLTNGNLGGGMPSH